MHATPMIYMGCPPTYDRYLAEIKNVLRLRTRPVCIYGPPKATVGEIKRFLNANRVSRYVLQVGGSKLIWWDDGLEIV